MRNGRGAGRQLGRESKGEVRERNLRPDAGIDLNDEACARKPYASPVQNQRPKVHMRSSTTSFLPHSRTRRRPRSTIRRPIQTFLAVNHDEHARRADCDPRKISRTPTDVSVPPATGLVRPLRWGAAAWAPHLGNLGLGKCIDVAYPRESAERDAARGAAEHPRCGSEEAAADRAEDCKGQPRPTLTNTNIITLTQPF